MHAAIAGTRALSNPVAYTLNKGLPGVFRRIRMTQAAFFMRAALNLLLGQQRGPALKAGVRRDV